MNEAAQATTNPALGVLIFALGGLAGAVFYLPFKKVKNWAWESYWLIYAVFGLVLVPWVLAFTTSPNVLSVLKAAPGKELGYCFLCGAMWGVGGLTWGLMIRYLGVGLGLAIGLRPLLGGRHADPADPARANSDSSSSSNVGHRVASSASLVSLAGIVAGRPGGHVQGKRTARGGEEEGRGRVQLQEGHPGGDLLRPDEFGHELRAAWAAPTFEKLAADHAPVTSPRWSGMPVLVVVLLGGFVVNAVWCLFLNVKNKTTGDYVKSATPLVGNFIFAGLAGAIWCSQFICFKTGEPAMGKTAYVGWAVLMACQILFSSLIGVVFIREWKGTSGRTKSLLAIGLALLILTTVVSGYGGYLGQQTAKPAAPAPVQEATPPPAQ